MNVEIVPPVRLQITGYLVQEKLESALAQVVGDTAWHGKEVQVLSGRRQRWDMVYTGPSGRVAVEFDGDEHYRNTLKIKNDWDKDGIARRGGYRVVRIPYWVQLTSETLKHYFDLNAEIIQDFPHGFICTKIFPASFCELGVERFRAEIESLPRTVRTAVISSLRDRVEEYGLKYVVPEKLVNLLV
jgi:very-short-patch-repair endonuclease